MLDFLFLPMSFTCFYAICFFSAMGTIFGIVPINFVKRVTQCTGLVCISLNNDFGNISIYKNIVIDFRVLAHDFTFFRFDFGYNKTRDSSSSCLDYYNLLIHTFINI